MKNHTVGGKKRTSTNSRSLCNKNFKECLGSTWTIQVDEKNRTIALENILFNHTAKLLCNSNAVYLCFYIDAVP